MILATSAAYKAARAQVHAVLLSGGSARLYTGTMPAGGEAVTDQILLAAFDLPDPAGAVVEGAFALAVVEAMAAAEGLAAWLRLLAADGAWVMDMDAGVTGSGAAAIVSPASLYAGGTVRIERLRLIEP